MIGVEMKKVILVLLVSVGFTLAGCHTVQGIGADIQDEGEAMEKAAQ